MTASASTLTIRSRVCGIGKESMQFSEPSRGVADAWTPARCRPAPAQAAGSKCARESGHLAIARIMVPLRDVHQYTRARDVHPKSPYGPAARPPHRCWSWTKPPTSRSELLSYRSSRTSTRRTPIQVLKPTLASTAREDRHRAEGGLGLKVGNEAHTEVVMSRSFGRSANTTGDLLFPDGSSKGTTRRRSTSRFAFSRITKPK